MKKFAEKEYLFFSVMALIALASLLITDKVFFWIIIIFILINTYYCRYNKTKIMINLAVVLLLLIAQLSWNFA
ncbi:hypothetical protein [Bacillus mojavensis]